MYSKIKIYGNCDVNYLWGKDELPDSEIEALKTSGITSPTWDATTRLLAKFNSDLNACSQLPPGVVGYYIHRRDITENKKRLIAKVSERDVHIKDYNISNTASYQYYITPAFKDNSALSLGNEIEPETVNVDCKTISIIGLTPTETNNVYIAKKSDIWTFLLNTDMDAHTLQYNKSVINTLGKYPKVYGDRTSYITGGGSFLLGDLSCDSIDYVHDDFKKINKWTEFCNNGQIKLFRDAKGQIIPCDITQTSYNYANDTMQMQTTVSFSFVQIDDSENISVYRIEE